MGEKKASGGEEALAVGEQFFQFPVTEAHSGLQEFHLRRRIEEGIIAAEKNPLPGVVGEDVKEKA